jgi:hypothetical protein
MKKPTYVKATLTLEPTMDAVKKKKAKASLLGPLIGKLVITGWKDRCPTTMDIEGTLVKPEGTSTTKAKKAKAPRPAKKKEQ